MSTDRDNLNAVGRNRPCAGKGLQMSQEPLTAQGQVDVNVRPPFSDRYAQAVTHADGTLHNFTLRIGSKQYRCECGCNVFHKPDRKHLELYECNSCGHRLEAA